VIQTVAYSNPSMTGTLSSPHVFIDHGNHQKNPSLVDRQGDLINFNISSETSGQNTFFRAGHH